MSKAGENIMVILSSPSGVGKTTITKKIQQKYNSFKISVSHTTRPPRSNEVNGVDYHFVTNKQFEKLINKDQFYEHAKIFNNRYGTLKKNVDNGIHNNDIIFDIDWQGADQIKNKKLHYKLITFFILPPSKEVLFERLSNRDMKDKLIVEERMKKFERDVLHWINYDYVVINEDVNACYSKIKDLIEAEINNGSKDYDKEYIKNHIEKLTS
jgi:guanylate kinase